MSNHKYLHFLLHKDYKLNSSKKKIRLKFQQDKIKYQDLFYTNETNTSYS